MPNSKVIHELLKEVRQDQKDANAKADKYREDTITWRAESNSRLDRYNNQLEVHIEGVNTLKGLHGDNVQRIEKLEAPRKALNMLRKWAIYIATICGTVLTLAKIKGLL